MKSLESRINPASMIIIVGVLSVIGLSGTVPWQTYWLAKPAEKVTAIPQPSFEVTNWARVPVAGKSFVVEKVNYLPVYVDGSQVQAVLDCPTPQATSVDDTGWVNVIRFRSQKGSRFVVDCR